MNLKVAMACSIVFGTLGGLVCGLSLVVLLESADNMDTAESCPPVVTSDLPAGCAHNIQVMAHVHDNDGTAMWPCIDCGSLLRWDSESQTFVYSECVKCGHKLDNNGNCTFVDH